MASRMMLAILTVLCLLNIVLFSLQSSKIEKEYRELYALTELNEKRIKTQKELLNNISRKLERIANNNKHRSDFSN